MREFFAFSLTLFLVIDALGNLPSYLNLTSIFPIKKRKVLAFRELLFALIIMFLFHYLGTFLLLLLNISAVTVQIGGGIILFLIALKLIFENAETEKYPWHSANPFIVPIATPIIAGPSVLAVVMILEDQLPSDYSILGSITLAWAASALVFFLGDQIYNLMKEKGLSAAKRLTGLIVSIIAVQTILRGIKELSLELTNK